MKELILLLTLLFALHTNANTDQHISVLGQLPKVSDVQVSPDGKNILFLNAVNGKNWITITSVKEGEMAPKYMEVGTGTLRDVEWLSAKHVWFSGTATHYSKADNDTFTLARSGVLNIDTMKVYWPFNTNRYRYNISAPKLLNKLADQPNKVAMSYYYSGVGQSAGNVYTVHIIDLEEEEREDIFKKSDSRNAHLDSKGNLISYQRWDGKQNVYVTYVLDQESDDFVELQDESGKALFDYNITGFDKKTNLIYYYDLNDDQTYIVKKAPLEGNKVGVPTVIAEQQGLDVDYTVKNYHSSHINGYVYIDDYPESYFFDDELNRIQQGLKATFSNASVRITAYTPDKQILTIAVSGDDYPNEYYIYNRKQKSLDYLMQGYEVKDRAQLGNVAKFTYTASDDTEIQSYVTIPAKVSDNKLPLIVMPHGGPESRTDMSFNWLRQFYALNGFAVFEPNFRGSSGYGKNFTTSGYGQWGKAMQQDVYDGVNAVIDKYNIDNNRVCIVGASYGGYVAMMAAIEKPKLFKCAVSFGGVSSLANLMMHSENQKNSISYWEKSIGDYSNKEELMKFSPQDIVKANSSPMLLVHGAKDTVVEPGQSKAMHNKLLEKGVQESKHIEIDGADHWFSKPETRARFLQESIAFINKYI